MPYPDNPPLSLRQRQGKQASATHSKHHEEIRVPIICIPSILVILPIRLVPVDLMAIKHIQGHPIFALACSSLWAACSDLQEPCTNEEAEHYSVALVVLRLIVVGIYECGYKTSAVGYRKLECGSRRSLVVTSAVVGVPD